MKFILSTAVLVSLLFANNVEARWKPTPGMTWNYVLGDDNFNVHSEKAQVIDVDYNKSASTIKEYHNAGKKVICYFSGGTLEKFRKDKDQYYKVNGLVRNKYEDWSDENWLDIRKEGLKPLIKNRMKEAVSKNCDAIEVDNLDGYQQSEVKSWSNPLTKSDTIAFAKWLGTTAHELGISIGLKNALFMINEVGSYFDFAVNESCATISNPECHLYKSFINQGKAVFGVSYKSRMSKNTNLCSNLKGLNISMIIKKNQELEQAGDILECGFNTGSSSSSSSNKTNNTKTNVSKPAKAEKPVVANNAVNANTANTNVAQNNKVANNNPINKATNNNLANNNKVINNVTGNNVANNNAVNPAIVNGNNTANNNIANPNAINQTPVNPATVQTPNAGSAPVKSTPVNQISSVDENNNDKDDNNNGTIITGFAITGSVVGAAGVFILLKKNPKQYENLKRNLSKKAKSVKRSASSLGRKLSTKKQNNTLPNYYEDTGKYRYEFTQNLSY